MKYLIKTDQYVDEWIEIVSDCCEKGEGFRDHSIEICGNLMNVIEKNKYSEASRPKALTAFFKLLDVIKGSDNDEARKFQVDIVQRCKSLLVNGTKECSLQTIALKIINHFVTTDASKQDTLLINDALIHKELIELLINIPLSEKKDDQKRRCALDILEQLLKDQSSQPYLVSLIEADPYNSSKWQSLKIFLTKQYEKSWVDKFRVFIYETCYPMCEPDKSWFGKFGMFIYEALHGGVFMQIDGKPPQTFFLKDVEAIVEQLDKPAFIFSIKNLKFCTLFKDT